MGDYNESDVTWSSIEKGYKYSKVNWYMGKNGIPRFILISEDGNKITIKVNYD